MSQSTKCNNARKKAAKRRRREEKVKEEILAAVKKLSDPEYSPAYPGLDDDRRSAPVNCSIRLSSPVKSVGWQSRHVAIEDRYKSKILQLQPIKRILPMFVNEGDIQHEALRINQERSAVAALKRRHGVMGDSYVHSNPAVHQQNDDGEKVTFTDDDPTDPSTSNPWSIDEDKLVLEQMKMGFTSEKNLVHTLHHQKLPNRNFSEILSRSKFLMEVIQQTN